MTEKFKGNNFPNSGKPLTPRLRFPGFEGEWEVKKLEEICRMQAGKFVSASKIQNNPNIDLFPCFGGNGLRGFTATFNQEGLYSLIGRQGALCGNVILANGKFYATEHAVVVTSNVDIDSIWMFYLLTHLNLNQYATGMAQPGLSVQNLYKVESSIPKSVHEQQRIASIFSLIDERISTQKKIIEELENLMKGFREKIFSQKLRFKDEDGNEFPEWERKKLGEVLSIPEKVKPQKIDKDKLLTVKLHMKGILKNESTDGLSIGSTSYYIRKKGQFIYGKQNLFNGAFGIIPDEFDGFLSSGDIPSLDIDVLRLNTKYLFNLFGRKSFYKKLEDIASGSGSKRIHEEKLFTIEIQLPSIKEQTKISNFISALEKKVDNNKIILTQYEFQKEYLLGNLFI